jgi:hypothetical protein
VLASPVVPCLIRGGAIGSGLPTSRGFGGCVPCSVWVGSCAGAGCLAIARCVIRCLDAKFELFLSFFGEVLRCRRRSVGEPGRDSCLALSAWYMESVRAFIDPFFPSAMAGSARIEAACEGWSFSDFSLSRAASRNRNCSTRFYRRFL